MVERSGMTEMFHVSISPMGTWVYSLSKLIACTLKGCAFRGRYDALKEKAGNGNAPLGQLPVAVIEGPQQGSVVAQGTAPVFPDWAGAAQPWRCLHSCHQRVVDACGGQEETAGHRPSPLPRSQPLRWLAFLPLGLSAP